jgi:Dolichyl-phosphate-mannose-protein mannosyltransferase
MHVVAGLVAYNLCFLAAGYGVLGVIRRRVALGDAGLAYLVGLAVVLISVSALATFGYVAGIPVFLAFTALFASGLLVHWHRGSWPALSWPHLGDRRPTWSAFWVLVFGLATIAYGVVLVRVSTVFPLTEWDAWSMWTMKAKALIVYGNLDVADWIGYGHPDYPLLVPELQSFTFRFMSSMNTEVIHVEYALITLAFIATVWRVLSGRVGAAVAAAWALYALLLPGLEVNVPDALGDVPVAIFASLAAFTFALWLRDRSMDWLCLYAIFGAAALWTKNEGSSAVLMIAVVGVLLSIRRPLIRNVIPPVVASVAIYLIFLPWTEWLKSQGIGHDRNLASGLHPTLLIREHARAFHAFSDLWSQLSTVDTWFALPYLSLLLVVVALVRRRDRRVAVFALLVPLGLFLSYVVVYTISTDPLGLDWYLSTSSSRVVTSVGLILATLLPVQVLGLVEPRALPLSDGPEDVADA